MYIKRGIYKVWYYPLGFLEWTPFKIGNCCIGESPPHCRSPLASPTSSPVSVALTLVPFVVLNMSAVLWLHLSLPGSSQTRPRLIRVSESEGATRKHPRRTRSRRAEVSGMCGFPMEKWLSSVHKTSPLFQRLCYWLGGGLTALDPVQNHCTSCCFWSRSVNIKKLTSLRMWNHGQY